MTLSLPEARYNSNEKVVSFYNQLIQRVEALPRVASAAIGGKSNNPKNGVDAP